MPKETRYFRVCGQLGADASHKRRCHSPLCGTPGRHLSSLLPTWSQRRPPAPLPPGAVRYPRAPSQFFAANLEPTQATSATPIGVQGDRWINNSHASAVLTSSQWLLVSAFAYSHPTPREGKPYVGQKYHIIAHLVRRQHAQWLVLCRNVLAWYFFIGETRHCSNHTEHTYDSYPTYQCAGTKCFGHTVPAIK